jgi:hypothetical protein
MHLFKFSWPFWFELAFTIFSYHFRIEMFWTYRWATSRWQIWRVLVADLKECVLISKDLENPIGNSLENIYLLEFNTVPLTISRRLRDMTQRWPFHFISDLCCICLNKQYYNISFKWFTLRGIGIHMLITKKNVASAFFFVFSFYDS